MRPLPRAAVVLSAALAALGCGDGPTVPDLPAPAASTAGTMATALAVLPDVRITEIHYDNAGTDVGEAIELRGPAGTDLTGWSVVLYNGSSGAVYDTDAPSGIIPTTCGADGVVVLTYPTNGIQNGAPDGVALVAPDGTVVELLSYEGSFTAVGGPADGMGSIDMGVAESSSTPAGNSLQLDATGVWQADAPASFGTCNGPTSGGGGGPGTPSVYVSELHYDNAGTDADEAVEIAAPANTDLTGWSVVFYNGSGGAPYATEVVTGSVPGSCRVNGGVVVAHAGIQNGAPDGLALVDPAGTVVEFLSYEGAFTAVGGPADGMTSQDIGVSEGGSDPAGMSLQRDAADTPWYGPAASTFGCDEPGGGGPSGPVFLSEVRMDEPGSDLNEYFELGGAPGTSLDGVTLLVLDNAAAGAGRVEHVTVLTGQALGAAGAFVAAESSFGLGTADLVTNLNFQNNGNPTLLLVRGFTGFPGQDLDVDDDGVLDTMPWTEVADCLSLIQYLGLMPIYCDARLGRTESFTPGHSVRTDGGWVSAGFTAGSDDTPGGLDFDPSTAVAGVLAPWGVGAPGEPTGLSVSATFVALPVGFNRALFVTVIDDYRHAVPGVTPTYTSTDGGIADADAFGNISANGAGTATLTIGVAGTTVATDVTVQVVPDVPSGVAFQDHTSFGAPFDADPSDDIVIRRDEYVVSYNPVRAGANWVAWNLDGSHIGSVDRCECYTPDPLLPSSAPRVVNFDFTGSGYSRGHMTQSFNRTVTLPDNAATYLTSNILPQAAANNTGPWGDFEFYTNGRAFAGEEVYILAGGQFSATPSTLKGEGKVAVPDYTWKVAIFLPRDGDLSSVDGLEDFELIAIRTPNRIEAGVPGSVVDEITTNDWEAYRVKVDEIEAATGYDLLDLLPDAFEEAVESGFDELAAAFDAAVADGSVKKKSAKKLSGKLDKADKELRKGKRDKAADQVAKFVKELDKLEKKGNVTPEAAAELRAIAEEVRRVLLLG